MTGEKKIALFFCLLVLVARAVFVTNTPQMPDKTEDAPDRDVLSTIVEEPTEAPAAYVPDIKELPPIDARRQVSVPVLMYHHLDETATGDMTISPTRFEEQISALSQAGYTSVSLQELYDYASMGAPLPEKPVLITFDDGYLSNYTLAFPILEKYGQKATIFAVGVTFGSDTYKDTGHAILPHFGETEAQEMLASGLISIQSHTFDMHQEAGLEGIPVRRGVRQIENESRGDYIAALEQDFSRSRSFIQSVTGESCIAIAFPYGKTSEIANAEVKRAGFLFSFTIKPELATVLRGDPESLYCMPRFTVLEKHDGQALLLLIQGEK